MLYAPILKWQAPAAFWTAMGQDAGDYAALTLGAASSNVAVATAGNLIAAVP